MNKLYLFGDSFSLFDTDLKDSMNSTIEFNTHHSLSNEHILKLVKLKLLKLSEMGIKKEDNVNILVQLTVCSRMCVLEPTKSDISTMMRSLYSYEDSMTRYGDKEIFQNKYYTLYPNLSSMKSELISMVFMPYLGFFITNNEKNILDDLLLELSVLSKLSDSIGVNFEYFFYSNNFDRVLSNKNLNTPHIKFGEHNSMQSYIESTRPDYFVSKMDIHFNDLGNKWYMKWLIDKYDI